MPPHAQQVDQCTGDDHQGNVEADQLARHAQRNHQRGQAQYHQDVEDVAAKDTADGYVGGALVGGLQAHGELRCRAAERDQAEADDQGAHAQAAGQAQGGAHQQLGTEDQRQQPQGQLQQAEGGEGGQVENGSRSVRSVAEPLYADAGSAASQHTDFLRGGL